MIATVNTYVRTLTTTKVTNFMNLKKIVEVIVWLNHYKKNFKSISFVPMRHSHNLLNQIPHKRFHLNR